MSGDKLLLDPNSRRRLFFNNQPRYLLFLDSSATDKWKAHQHFWILLTFFYLKMKSKEMSLFQFVVNAKETNYPRPHFRTFCT